MNKHACWAWAIKNSVVMIYWTAMAIFFEKWWIALFGAVCLSNLHTESKGEKENAHE